MRLNTKKWIIKGDVMAYTIDVVLAVLPISNY